MNEQDIQRGFNKGYVLHTHVPDLAAQFQQMLSDRNDDYVTGFLAGVKQREQELQKTYIRTIPPPQRSGSSKGRSRSPEKDIGREDR